MIQSGSIGKGCITVSENEGLSHPNISVGTDLNGGILHRDKSCISSALWIRENPPVKNDWRDVVESLNLKYEYQLRPSDPFRGGLCVTFSGVK